MTNRLFIHGRDLLLALDATIYADTLEPVSSRPDTSQIIVIDWERVQETDKTLIMAKAGVDKYVAFDILPSGEKVKV